MLVKTDLDGFYRDTTTNAVINTNVEKINQYKKQREEKIRMDSVIQEVESLRHDINEIKSMLLHISKRL